MLNFLCQFLIFVAKKLFILLHLLEQLHRIVLLFFTLIIIYPSLQNKLIGHLFKLPFNFFVIILVVTDLPRRRECNPIGIIIHINKLIVMRNQRTQQPLSSLFQACWKVAAEFSISQFNQIVDKIDRAFNSEESGYILTVVQVFRVFGIRHYSQLPQTYCYLLHPMEVRVFFVRVLKSGVLIIPRVYCGDQPFQKIKSGIRSLKKYLHCPKDLLLRDWLEHITAQLNQRLINMFYLRFYVFLCLRPHFLLFLIFMLLIHSIQIEMKCE